MSKKRTFVTLAATALATLFIASSTIEPAVAKSGGHGGGGGGGRSMGGGGGGGGKSFSGGGMKSFSGGGKSFSGGGKSFSYGGSSKVYGYKSHGHHRHHHHRHSRVFLYGAPYVDSYGYTDSCYWLRRRALATGSSYWWNRYYDCINDY